MANTENRKNEELMNELNMEDLGKVSGGVGYETEGGNHLQTEVLPVPEDLKKILDEKYNSNPQINTAAAFKSVIEYQKIVD